MFAELLSAIGSRHTWSTSELARRLRVEEGALALMLEDLARRGYVESPEESPCCCPSCGGACAGCPMRARPGPAEMLRVWRITDKGRAARMRR